MNLPIVSFRHEIIDNYVHFQIWTDGVKSGTLILRNDEDRYFVDQLTDVILFRMRGNGVWIK